MESADAKTVYLGFLWPRLGMLVGYALRVAGLPIGHDVHSGYFNHPEVARALYGAAEFSQPLRHVGSSMADWATEHGVRVLAIKGSSQVERAVASSASG